MTHISGMGTRTDTSNHIGMSSTSSGRNLSAPPLTRLPKRYPAKRDTPTRPTPDPMPAGMPYLVPTRTAMVTPMPEKIPYLAAMSVILVPLGGFAARLVAFQD